jgi:multiple sugar transport system substrate-binding protein
MDMDVVEPIEGYLSKELLDNIPESIMEGKLNNVLYGLPFAIGPRLMLYRTDLIDKAPATFEEMREAAIKVHSEDVYGVGMSGAKYAELTEFAYYLYGNGGISLR